MNILPTKSWHVRNKDNIERVRRDEENARKEEEEKQRRAALADSEARTDLLRSKAQLRQRDSDAIHEGTSREIASVTMGQSQHINFFSDLEEGKKTKKGNEEYEKEKREEKEKQEKAIGLLTYLGQSSVESLGANKPWYLNRDRMPTEEEDKQKIFVRKERDTKSKHSQDPMRMMSKYIGTKHKVEGKPYQPFIPQRQLPRVEERRMEKRKRSPSSSSEAESTSSSSSSEEEHEKRKKHKKKHKKKSKKHKKKKKKHKKHKNSSREKPEKVTLRPSSSSSNTLQQLRAERLKREQPERLKTQKLLRNVNDSDKKGANSDSEKVEMDERKRGYNSQFNPELARNKKRKKIDYSDFD